MIDFHCHLDLYPKPAEIVAEVAKRGTYVLAVTTTPRSFDGNLLYVGDTSRIRVAVGLHPELVKERHAEIDLLRSLLPRTRYVGEVGLDGSPQHRQTLDLQRQVLSKVLRACREEGGKIVSFHSRMAATPVLDVLEEAGDIGTAVMHWFSGTIEEAARATALGCWFSVGPAMLQSSKGRKLVATMPNNRVVPESDGPFGKIADKAICPWEAASVIPVLGELWRKPASTIETIIKANFQRLVRSEG